MANIVIPHQYCSFKGIYTMPGGVFTPGPLDLSQDIAVWPDVNVFTNVTNRLLLILRNTDVSNDEMMDMHGIPAKILDPPYWHVNEFLGHMYVDIGPAISPPIQNAFQIIGPFSQNFEPSSDITIEWFGLATPGTVKVAAVVLPE